MKIKQLIIIGLSTLITSFASAALPPANANFVFTLPGTTTTTVGATYQPTATFSFSIRLNYPGPAPANILSLSYWFEVPTALAPFITITSQVNGDGSPGSPSSFSQNLAPLSDFPIAFNTAGDAGNLRDNAVGSGGDLGGSSAIAITPTAGTFYISTLTFHLAGAPLGTYALDTTLSPPSSVSNSAGSAFTLPQSQYLITIVPEPATWSLIALGGLGAAGLNFLRARKKS